MIQLEGWTESPLLPEGWLFKVLKVGVSGEARAFRSTSNIGGKLWSSEMVYLTKEGASLSSMAAVKEYMEKSPKYNFEDITNFKAFLSEDGTTPEDLRMQILRSVEVAPWGLKKYKSNQKPGKQTSLPQKVNPNSTLPLPTKEDEWSEEDEDEANIPYDEDDSDEEVKTKVSSESKKDYEPFIYQMIPSRAAKEMRYSMNMLTLARRPFQLIKKEKANWENVSSDDAAGTSERKRKLDVNESYPDLRVQYPSEEEIIKNVVLSKRQRTSRQIG